MPASPFVKELDGIKIEGTQYSHQVPIKDPANNPVHLQALEQWLRSYRVHELIGSDGHILPELLATCPEGDRRMGTNPITHARAQHLNIPDCRQFMTDVSETYNQRRARDCMYWS